VPQGCRCDWLFFIFISTGFCAAGVPLRLAVFYFFFYWFLCRRGAIAMGCLVLYVHVNVKEVEKGAKSSAASKSGV
jgi:hypothetical protein